MYGGPRRIGAGRTRRAHKVLRGGVFLLCGLSAACASSGTSPGGNLEPNTGFAGGTSVQGGFTNAVSSVRDSVVTHPRGSVWAVMPSVFERLGIETPTVDAVSYTIGNPGARTARLAGTRLSVYLDCGSGVIGPNADRYDVTLQLMVQLAARPAQTTLVRTQIDAFARPRDASGRPIQCASLGTLEREVVELIARSLDGPEAGEAGTASSLGPGPATPGSTVVYRGGVGTRYPAEGDVLRLECISPGSADGWVGQGLFMGGGEGELLLQSGPERQLLTVPVPNVGSVQIRQQTSRAKLGGVLGGLVAGGLGAYVGSNAYDRGYRTASGRLVRRTHYGQGVYIVLGAVAGVVSGALVGSLTGSFIKQDNWIEAPTGWTARYSDPDSPRLRPCPAGG